jgi:hypothetical protein
MKNPFEILYVIIFICNLQNYSKKIQNSQQCKIISMKCMNGSHIDNLINKLDEKKE